MYLYMLARVVVKPRSYLYIHTMNQTQVGPIHYSTTAFVPMIVAIAFVVPFFGAGPIMAAPIIARRVALPIGSITTITVPRVPIPLGSVDVAVAGFSFLSFANFCLSPGFLCPVVQILDRFKFCF